MSGLFFRLLVAFASVFGNPVPSGDELVDSLSSECPGYNAFNVNERSSSLTADLYLAGPACNVYGDDLRNLTLSVTYETGKHWLTY